MNEISGTNGNGVDKNGLLSLVAIKLSLQGSPILNDVNLHMAKGEIYGLLGPNGAGKTTTISVITTLRTPDAGAVTVLGRNPAFDPGTIRQRIGVLAENAGAYGWMTGAVYLRWFAGLYGIELKLKDTHSLLSRVGLSCNNRTPVSGYSSGMKQRLGLARALVNNPELLILDEPTNGLDPEGRRDIHDLLLDLNRRHGIGILLSTHLLDDVERLCGRIGIIHRGKTILEGETRAVGARGSYLEHFQLRLKEPFPDMASPLGPDIKVTLRENDQVLVELAAGVQADEVWRLMLERGWSILEIRRKECSLEDVYLAAVRKGEHDESHDAYCQ